MATTTESLKERAYAIAEEVMELPRTQDRAHDYRARRLLLDRILLTVPVDDRMIVREWAKQFIKKQSIGTGWVNSHSNSRLFPQRGKA